MTPTAMIVLALSVLLGGVAGLRTLVPPTVPAWAAYGGLLDVSATPFFFLGHLVSPLVFTAMAAGELVADKLPRTPARTVPVQFGSRLASGAFAGTALGFAGPASPLLCGMLGVAGALAGTIGGLALRRRLATMAGRDRPAALAEDAIAVSTGIVLVLFAAR
jgi:uncharacterized membrane protein